MDIKEMNTYLNEMKTVVNNNLKCIYKFMSDVFHKYQIYPRVLQFPITYLCNFDCKMCGMRKLLKNEEMNCEQLSKILEDKLFHKINAIGINGGEPFMKKNIVECIKILIDKLEDLKYFYFISNGYFTQSILDNMKVIHAYCEKKGIKVELSISVDGIADMQDFMRGKEGAFQHVTDTVDEILKERNRYCDKLSVICTITKYNIARINEVDIWAKEKNIDIEYNIASINERIHNQDKVGDFDLFSDKQARFLATEFFYQKYYETLDTRYFSMYLFMRDGVRHSGCDCKALTWVTLLPDGYIAYCATHSKKIGDAREKSAYSIFRENKVYSREIEKQYCNTCCHYITDLSIKDLHLYNKECIRKILWG